SRDRDFEPCRPRGASRRSPRCSHSYSLLRDGDHKPGRCCRTGVLPRAGAITRAGEAYRSIEVKHEFQRQHPCPSTARPTAKGSGFIKDHVAPLACGGPDWVGNLQWQTTAAAKAKDKWERKNCGR